MEGGATVEDMEGELTMVVVEATLEGMEAMEGMEGMDLKLHPLSRKLGYDVSITDVFSKKIR